MLRGAFCSGFNAGFKLLSVIPGYSRFTVCSPFLLLFVLFGTVLSTFFSLGGPVSRIEDPENSENRPNQGE